MSSKQEDAQVLEGPQSGQQGYDDTLPYRHPTIVTLHTLLRLHFLEGKVEVFSNILVFSLFSPYLLNKHIMERHRSHLCIAHNISRVKRSYMSREYEFRLYHSEVVVP